MQAGSYVRLILRPRVTGIASRASLIASGDLIDLAASVTNGFTPHEVNVTGAALGIGSPTTAPQLSMNIPVLSTGDWVLDTDIPLTAVWADPTQPSPSNRPWHNKFLRGLLSRWNGAFSRIVLTSNSPLDPSNAPSVENMTTSGMFSLYSIT